MTDTPIYDQLRLELSSRRSVPDSSPPKPRARTERAPAKPVAPVKPPVKPAAKPVVAETETRKPVSVWTLVNANRKA